MSIKNLVLFLLSLNIVLASTGILFAEPTIYSKKEACLLEDGRYDIGLQVSGGKAYSYALSESFIKVGYNIYYSVHFGSIKPDGEYPYGFTRAMYIFKYNCKLKKAIQINKSNLKGSGNSNYVELSWVNGRYAEFTRGLAETSGTTNYIIDLISGEIIDIFNYLPQNKIITSRYVYPYYRYINNRIIEVEIYKTNLEEAPDVFEIDMKNRRIKFLGEGRRGQ